VDAPGLLTAGSAGGVFGSRTLSLSSTASDAAQGSVVTSPSKSVHLDQEPDCCSARRPGASGGSRGSREPDAARPTGPRGSSTDKWQPRCSVLEPNHRRVPRGTRPVLG